MPDGREATDELTGLLPHFLNRYKGGGELGARVSHATESREKIWLKDAIDLHANSPPQRTLCAHPLYKEEKTKPPPPPWPSDKKLALTSPPSIRYKVAPLCFGPAIFFWPPYTCAQTPSQSVRVRAPLTAREFSKALRPKTIFFSRTSRVRHFALL